MDEFVYQRGALCCEAVAASDLAERFGTPLYVYSQKTFVDHFVRFRQAFASLEGMVCFSVKSCQNLAILRLLSEHGAAFDVVSRGELSRVLEVGADPKRVVFAGVGKRSDEIRHALEAGIGWFNVESPEELRAIAAIAQNAGHAARVALRVNPDVDPHTHAYTTTGKRETKFGMDFETARTAARDYLHDRAVRIEGIHLHLGSPVNTIDPYLIAIRKCLTFIDELRSGSAAIRALNIGGGFGAHYHGSEAPSAAAYAEQIVPLLAGRGLEILLEPGRSIAANAGVLLTRVLYAKQSGERKFLIVDAAITELIRPALYGAYHFVWPVSPGDGFVPVSRAGDLHMSDTELVDVVGPVCESGDFLAKDRRLPTVNAGDLLCVFTTGAYGFTMSSQYNSRPRAAEVLVNGTNARLIRRRENYDDLVAAERNL